MDKTFVDTNYFIRLVVGEPLDQNNQAKELFKKGAESELRLFTSVVVIFEIYWVLSTFYKKDKKEVACVLGDILKMDFVEVENRDLLLNAVETYQKTRLDLEDSYNLCFAVEEKAKHLATFDKILTREFSKLV